MSKQIFMFSLTHPIDNIEFMEATLKTELTDPALSADVAEPMLKTDATENTDIAAKTLINDINDIIVI